MPISHNILFAALAFLLFNAIKESQCFKTVQFQLVHPFKRISTKMSLGYNDGGARDGRAKITFVTGNSNKLKEVRMIVQSTMDSSLEVDNKDIDLPEFQGEAEVISREKCKLAAKQVGGPVIVEDTSLCFNGIGGMPGPYVKWFHQSIGNDGMYRMLEGFGDKTGYAQCALSFSLGPGHEPKTFLGIVHGNIVEPEDRNSGFGWDPLFQPNGYTVTFSQMEKTEKNKISHRSQAMKLFKEYLQENPEVLQRLIRSNAHSSAEMSERRDFY